MLSSLQTKIDSSGAMIRYRALSIGWAQGNVNLIEEILRKVEERTNIDFVHFVSTDIYFKLIISDYYQKKLYKFPDEVEMVQSDEDYLASLEKSGDFTINNLILSDRVLCRLENNDAIMYCTTIAKKIEEIILSVKPHFILGSWDSVIPGLANLVAKKYNVPVYTTKFSVIPSKHLAICQYPNPNLEIPMLEGSSEQFVEKAREHLDQWAEKKIVAPAYISVMTPLDIVKKTPFYVMEFYNKLFNSCKYGANRFTSYSLKDFIRQYIRKKSNVLTMSKGLFINDIPEKPFFFYGLHMQPESSIDVWAPFYADQYRVIVSISRSMPIDHFLCIKIHISDADNYSNRQLKQLIRIPGVRVVSPFVGSRDFIENAKIVFSIQGTIGLEAALLGKPVIMFGDSAVVRFPSASKVHKIEDLPSLVKEKLNEEKPSKEMIINGYADFLKNYMPGSSDDWISVVQNGLTEEEINNYVRIMERLCEIATQDVLQHDQSEPTVV